MREYLPLPDPVAASINIFLLAHYLRLGNNEPLYILCIFFCGLIILMQEMYVN